MQTAVDHAFDCIEKSDLRGAKAICRFLAKSQETVVDSRFLLGVIAYKENRLKEAIESLTFATEARPLVIEYHKILGDVLRADGKIEKAISFYRQGFSLNHENIPIGMSLARALRLNGKEGEALKVVSEMSRQHGGSTFSATLASWHLLYVPTSSKKMIDMRRDYEQAVRELETNNGLIDENLLVYLATNFLAAYQGANDRRFQALIANFYLRSCPGLRYQSSHIGENSNQKLRIGFASENLRNHTVGYLYQGLISQFHKLGWEVYVYGSGQIDELTNYLRANCFRFHALPTNLPEARELISADRLDILYYAEIGMNSLTYFLAFSRLAQLQCVGWGHPVTTGIPSIDLFISSKHLETDDIVAAENHYTERLIRLNLPPTFLYPFQYDEAKIDCFKSISEDMTIYFCPQTMYKIHPDFDPLIIEILRRDPRGIVIFIDGQGNWKGALQKRWRSIDANASKRIKFVKRADKKLFLSMLAQADVILDTIYFSGGITSAEALSVGTPVITYAGTNLMAGRVTYGYYQQIGVLDCIATSFSAYVELAVKMGINKVWRNIVSDKIRRRQHLLFERSEVVEELAELFLAQLESLDATKRKRSIPPTQNKV